MKINWKDPFGKKRIAQLEAENKILNDMLDDHGRLINDKKSLKIQKFKASYRTNYNYLETPDYGKFVKKELSKKLVEELYFYIAFDGRFDEDTLTYEYTASLEVVL